MRNLRNDTVLLAAIAAIALAASPAASITTSSNMSVGITVTSSCGLSVSNINFETMDPTARESAPTSATAGPLTYACSPGSVSPSISYGQGLHYSGGNQMAGATTGATIPYSLTMPTIAAFAGPRRTARISATIPARTALPSADVFSDTVILTVSY